MESARLNKFIIVFSAMILMMLCPNVSLSQTDLTTSLVSYWSFDIDARDDSGNGHNGSLVGTTYHAVGGKIGGCFSFDGDDYITTTTLGNWGSQMTQHTISLWIRWTDSSVVYPLGSAKTSHANVWISLNGNVAGRIHYYFQDNSQSPGSVFTPAGGYNDGVWHHVVGVYDFSQNKATLFVDGEPVHSVTCIADNFANLEYPFVIGAWNRNGIPSGHFIGAIDEIGIWNRSLTSSEIESLYSNGNGLAYPFILPNQPPEIEPIEDITFSYGETYPLNLDNYVSDDDPKEDLIWLCTGNDEVSFSIDQNRVATFSGASGWIGTETITLQVTDPGGLSDSASVQVTVNPSLQITVLDDATGSPLAGALVAIDEVQEVFTTDEIGNVDIIEPLTGTRTIYAFMQGYLPRDVTHDLDLTDTVVIGLVEGEIVTTNVTIEEMTEQEIIDAGVDLEDPENFWAYKFTVTLAIYDSEVQVEEPVILPKNPEPGTYYPVPGGIPFTIPTGIWGIYGPSDFISGVIRAVVIFFSGGTGGGGSGGDPGGDPGVPGEEEQIHRAVAFIIIPGQVEVLKEFLKVTMRVQNLAPPIFSINDSISTINLPSGLTLVELDGQEQPVSQSMENIPGGTEAEAEWVIRGDEEGTYTVSVDFSGSLWPFNFNLSAIGSEDVTVHGKPDLAFIFDTPAEVVAGEEFVFGLSLRNDSTFSARGTRAELFTEGFVNVQLAPGEEAEKYIGTIESGETKSTSWHLVSTVSGYVGRAIAEVDGLRKPCVRVVKREMGITHIEYAPLQPGIESSVKVHVLAPEAGDYLVRVYDENSVSAPQWYWDSEVGGIPATGEAFMNANEERIFILRVTPPSYGIGGFAFRLYTKVFDSPFFLPDIWLWSPKHSYKQNLIVDRPSLEEDSQWSKEEVQALVNRYAPVLKMCSAFRGEYIPKEVRIALENAVLKDRDGNTVISGSLSNELLYRFSGPDYYIDLEGNSAEELWENWKQIQGNYDTAFYATAVQNSSEIAIQYWIPYYCSDWRRHGGLNNHEWDWENIIIILEKLGPDIVKPLYTAYSQHNTYELGDGLSDTYFGGHTRSWDRTAKLRLGNGELTDHPIVYVGKGGHASYFTSGFKDYKVLVDLGIEHFNGAGNWVIPSDSFEKIDYYSGEDAKKICLDEVVLLPRATSISDSGEDCSWVIYSGLWGQKDLPGGVPPELAELFKMNYGCRGPAFAQNAAIFAPVFEGGYRWLDPWGWAMDKPPDPLYIPIEEEDSAVSDSDLQAHILINGEEAVDGGETAITIPSGIVEFEVSYIGHPMNNVEVKYRLEYGNMQSLWAGTFEPCELLPIIIEHDYIPGADVKFIVWEERTSDHEWFAVDSVETSVLLDNTIPYRSLNGITFGTWDRDGYSENGTAYTSLFTLRETGANWVSIFTTWYQDDISSTTIYRHDGEDPGVNYKTPNDEDLKKIIAEAHRLGLMVMLKPHVNLPDGSPSWRGEIGTEFDKDSDEWQEWFSDYQTFILHYADLAQEKGVGLFCIGTELQGTSQRDEWMNLIDHIRARYFGPITYAATTEEVRRHLEGDRIGWWDELNYIGVDAYYEMAEADNEDPTLDELLAAWSGHVGVLSQLSSSLGNKQIVLTEIGYRSKNGTAMEPWKWEYGERLDVDVDLDEQTECYDAAFQSLYDQPWLKGMFWWTWMDDSESGGYLNNDYTPQNKPAQYVLSECYGDSLQRPYSIDIVGKYPVDLTVVDPDGRIVSKMVSQIPDALYIEEDISGNGEPDDKIQIPAPLEGRYSVDVMSGPDANPTDTYILQVISGRESLTLARDAPVGNIPINGYSFGLTVTENPDGSYYITIQTPSHTPEGTNVVVQPPDELTGATPVVINFAQVTFSGETYLTMSSIGPSPPSGFQLGDPPTYYYLTTTATPSGSIRVCIDYSGVSFNHESSLTLCHFENGEWVPGSNPTLDTEGDTICASFTSLSPFAIFEPISAEAIASVKGAGWYTKVSSFRNTVMLDVTSNNGTIESGSFLKYLDGQTRMLLMSTDISSLNVSDNTATITGNCTVNRDTGYTFEAIVTDGNPDTFSISVAGEGFSYDSSGTLEGGDLSITLGSGGVTAPMEIPEETVLLQNYPNPPNPETWIPFKLSQDSDVTIEIYDMTGRLMKRLQLGYIPAGYYVSRDKAAHWDGRNEAGEEVASGVYFYTVNTGEYRAVKKMIVVR